MKKGNYLSSILRSPKTVFSTDDIFMLWGEPSSKATRVRLNYYVRHDKLYRIRRGLYAKDKDYNKLELATRIFTPSYVSFETVLSRDGIIFQFYTQIFVASYLTREVTVDGQVYSFKKIKNAILTDPVGVEHQDETSVANKERAFLDILYRNTDYYFDNLGEINWDRVFQMLPIYNNKRLSKKVNEIHNQVVDKNQST